MIAFRSHMILLLLCWLVFPLHFAGGQEPVREWPYEFHSENYIVHSDFSPENTLLNRELNEVSVDIATLLEIPPPPQPIHIVLFGTQREYARYMQAYFPKLPKRRALFIQDRGPGMLFTHWHADIGVDLRHEMTHALINNRRPLPLWLDEGLAEYFELDRGSRIRPRKRIGEVLKHLNRGTITTIESLAKIESLEEFDDRDYLISWAWIHFLMHRNVHTRELLIRHLNDLRSERLASFKQEHSELENRLGNPSFSLHRALAQLFPDVRKQFFQHFSSLAEASPAPDARRVTSVYPH